MTTAGDAYVEFPPDAVQLTGRVVADGDRFLAAVDGLGLEARGATPEAAQDSLVQTMRGWLERLDSSGKLGTTLGLEDLAEESEIVLTFVAEGGDGTESLD